MFHIFDLTLYHPSCLSDIIAGDLIGVVIVTPGFGTSQVSQITL